MLNLFKSKKKTTEVQEQPVAQKSSLFSRLREGLKRTRQQFGEGLAQVLLGSKTIDAEILEKIETQLLVADVGVMATQEIIADLTQKMERRQLIDGDALYRALQQHLLNLLQQVEKPLTIAAEKKPFVLLVVGVNGVGKTTTIGKLAKRLKADGQSVLLAAGDTFRAAAIEQLKIWGERNQVPVVAQQLGSDSASVIFDAMQAAQARQVDVVIADTAGRLHTKKNLMDELKKIKRVMSKLDEQAPHEVLLVLDASTGQNALQQAKQFHAAVGLTGIALTKLDGTAKGGIIFALAEQLAVPIRYIGIGEQIDDLRPFVAEDFVKAILT